MTCGCMACALFVCFMIYDEFLMLWYLVFDIYFVSWFFGFAWIRVNGGLVCFVDGEGYSICKETFLLILS